MVSDKQPTAPTAGAPYSADLETSILHDPRMDGETWILATDVTQAMLDAWPVWEAQRQRHPRIWAWLASDWYPISLIHDVSVRPLRLPGMNAKGEIPAKDMRPEFFKRVDEWQFCIIGGSYPRPWHGSPAFCFHDVRADNLCEYWRPTIFEDVAIPPASTLGDTIDVLRGEQELADFCTEWQSVESVTRRALLCALTALSFDESVLEQSGRYMRLRHETSRFPVIVLDQWDWRGAWDRLLALDRREHGALTEIRACRDCPCCHVRDDYDPEIGGPIVLQCSDAPSLLLTNGHLSRRPADCPRVGTMATWPAEKP